MNKLAAISFVAVTVTALMAAPVFAQAANRQPAATAKCSNMSSRIDTHISRLSDRLGKTEAMYTKHDAKVQHLITKAKTKGTNSDKAQADLQTWESQTTALKNARNQLLAQLNTAKATSCSDNPSGFKAAVQTAKDEVKAINNLKQTKQSYFTTTMKPDLTALRDQLKSKAN